VLPSRGTGEEARLDVKLTEGPEAFDLPEWPELLARDPYRHIFATPEWSRVWWEEFGAGRRLCVLTFCDPEPVGLAPLVLDPEAAMLSFLGGDDLTDYMGPISDGHESQRDIADALLAYALDDIGSWCTFDARCLPVPFGFAEWLVEAADRRGLPFLMDEHEMTAVLSLPGSFDAYLNQLGGSRRHELRRKLRRFEEAAPDARLTTATHGSLEADLEDFFAMHRSSEGEKGKFMGPERAGFFARIARTFEPLGLLSLDFLEVGGKRVASTFSFTYSGNLYLYNSAFDPDVAALSPGIMIVVLLIRRCIEQGMGRFDFLRGTERYKFELGAERLPLHAVSITRPEGALGPCEDWVRSVPD
jgi:CelD/BcsL family acetyltransferase involved in cellulose biosynthesis